MSCPSRQKKKNPSTRSPLFLLSVVIACVVAFQWCLSWSLIANDGHDAASHGMIASTRDGTLAQQRGHQQEQSLRHHGTNALEMARSQGFDKKHPRAHSSPSAPITPILPIAPSFATIPARSAVSAIPPVSATLPGLPSIANLTFVHVGKTGGETIKWRLRVICNQRKSRRKKARCFEQFQDDESQLSTHTTGYMHCNAVRPRHCNVNATAYLISTRDPISRIVSWFQYMHPDNCLTERPSAACNLKKKETEGYQWGQDFFRICFPTVDDMLRALRSSQSQVLVGNDRSNEKEGGVDCTRLATAALQGNGPEGPSNHLHFNYNFYANHTIHLFPSKHILVIRQEHLWDDMRMIETMLINHASQAAKQSMPLPATSHRSFENEGPVVTHGSELFPHKTALTATQLLPDLCCVILQEIQVYVHIIQRSSNLNSQQKTDTIQTTLDKCKINSVAALEDRCQQDGK